MNTNPEDINCNEDLPSAESTRHDALEINPHLKTIDGDEYSIIDDFIEETNMELIVEKDKNGRYRRVHIIRQSPTGTKLKELNSRENSPTKERQPPQIKRK